MQGHPKTTLLSHRLRSRPNHFQRKPPRLIVGMLQVVIIYPKHRLYHKIAQPILVIFNVVMKMRYYLGVCSSKLFSMAIA